MSIDLNEEDVQEALLTGREIDQIADLIKTNERTVSSSWVKLGGLAHKVRQRKFWSVYGHTSFGSFVASLEPKVNRKRSQVYLCVGVVETLGSQIPEEKLQEMGISAANELKKYAKESGKLVPQSLVDYALDPKHDVEEIRAEVSKALHKTPEEKGKWYEIGGFFVTDEEKKLIEDCVEIAKNLDPVVPHDIAEHAQRKEVVLRWCMEFQSTYGGTG
jgi:hypothetical protein